MEGVKAVSNENNAEDADRNKGSEQPRLDRLAQHDERRQTQRGNGHHEAEDRAEQRAFSQQCLGHGDRTEDIRVHRHADKRREHDAKRIITSEDRLYPGLGDPVVDDRPNAHPDEDIRKDLFEGGDHK